MGTSGLGSFMASAVVVDISCFTAVVAVDDVFAVADAMVDSEHYSHK